MVTITQDQAFKRWDTLPLVLREALYSEANSDFLWKTCEAEHLPETTIRNIARLAGYVYYGFLHPEDMADEMKAQLGLDPKICKTIADAINGRLFTPLKAEIDKILNPMSKFEVGPKILQDIGPLSRATPPPTPSPISKLQASKPSVPAQPVQPPTGWSKSIPQQPVVKFSEARPVAGAQAVPIQPPPPPPPPAKKPVPQGTMGEFERLGIRSEPKVSPVATPQIPKPPTVTPTPPPPTMLHQDDAFKAQPQAGFHIQVPIEEFDLRKGPPAARPIKPAVLELGGAPAQIQKPGMASTRVVHYSQYKSPSPETPILPNIPSPSAGPRQITEFTVQNFPSKPPTPPSPPTPPQSPTNT